MSSSTSLWMIADRLGPHAGDRQLMLLGVRGPKAGSMWSDEPRDRSSNAVFDPPRGYPGGTSGGTPRDIDVSGGMRMLSDHERRALRDIERSVGRDDPRFASSFTAHADGLPAVEKAGRRKPVMVALAVLTVLSVALGLTAVAVVTAALLVVVGSPQMRRALRRLHEREGGL